MAKAKVKLDLRNKNVAEKIQFARQIVTSLTANATNFPKPDPSLDEITAGANELERTYNEAESLRDAAKAKTAMQNDKESALDRLLTKAGNYVENSSNGEVTIIKSSGFSIRGENVAAATKNTKPSRVVASVGHKEGEIDLQWEPVRLSKSYMIQCCPDPVAPEAWIQATVSTKSKVVVTGLQGAKKYWFRIAAVTSEGQSAWSDAVAKVAQ